MFQSKILVMSALLIAGLATGAALLFHFMDFSNISRLVIAGAVVFFISFFIATYFLHNNVDKQLEMLYRLIYSSNRADAKNVGLKQMKREVKHWSKEQRPIIKQYQEKEKYRKEFIGDMAHELRTPIFNIQGYVCTLLDGALYDDKINKKYLRKAQKNIDRMIYMVEDLDLITKLESGELVLNKHKFKLKEALEDALEEVEMRAMDKDIKLHLSSVGKDAFVYAEKNHIMRVLVNLIANSVKYGKEGGRTTVSVKNNGANRYWIIVSDNGIGIKKEDLSHIFKRFYRVDKSRSRNIGGSGLGLSIVKHILEIHGESIKVKSVFGEGTTFQFSLQKADSQTVLKI